MDAKKNEKTAELSSRKKAIIYLLAALGPHAIALFIIVVKWFFSGHDLPCWGEIEGFRKTVYVLDLFCAEMRSAFAFVSLLMFIAAPIVYYIGRDRIKITKGVAFALAAGALLGLVAMASMQFFLQTFTEFRLGGCYCISQPCCSCWNPTCGWNPY